MRLLQNTVIIILAFLIFFPAPGIAATLRVSWNANTETDLGGYLIYYGTQSGNYIACYDVGKVTSYGITGVQSGTTIYIAMAAYDTSQNDSALSAEQHITVPNVTTTVTVPNVVGKTQAAASSALTSALLTTGTITQAYSSTVASGYVISQSPASGTSAASGSAVNLTVSKGPQPVMRTVPNVVGKTQAAASSALTSALLTTGTITQAYSSTVASGYVISQSPASGTSVASGSAVNLTVSKGPQPVMRTVPNVVGKTQAAASSALTSALLTTGTITQAYSSTVASGYVISQSPASGTSVASGSAVNLTVSKGPQQSAVYLLSPVNGSVVSTIPTLKWSGQGISQYTLRGSIDSGSTWTTFYTGTGTSYTSMSSVWNYIKSGATLAWYVQGTTSSGSTVKSSIGYFTKK